MWVSLLRGILRKSAKSFLVFISLKFPMIFPVSYTHLDVYKRQLRELRYQGNNLNQLTVMARQGRITQVNYEPFTEVYRCLLYTSGPDDWSPTGPDSN